MTGIYLLTDDRWMPETMIQMTLNHPAFKPERLASMEILTYGASPIPGVLLEGLLILSEQSISAQERKAMPASFKPDRLPKLPARGR